jgi:tetratricopeptide (TPR) repeat protein
LALVWAVGYLQDTGFTLKQVLDRQELFADFDKEQGKDADRYENKGLKRLHYEQLKIQSADSLPLLTLLAFFKRPVPKGALVHLLDEVELSRTLTRLERNRLITHKESSDAYTRFLNHDLENNLYGLHPVICENEFFDALPGRQELYEAAAERCWERADAAYEVKRFAYSVELLDCAEKLFEHLTKELKRAELLENHAAMLMNKGVALWSLTRLGEAIAEYDKSIAIRERLVHEEQQTHLANDLAMTYMNKGNALQNLARLGDAITEYDKAIAIRERLVNEEQQTHLANELARAYMNKALALKKKEDIDEALSLYEKSLQARTFCVEELKMFWIMPELLMTLRFRFTILLDLQRWADVARDVLQLQFLLTSYINSDGIDEGLKETARKEFVGMISVLKALDPDKRELLLAEMGSEVEAVRSILEG